MKNEGPVVSSFGVDKQGITGIQTAYWNLPPARLVELAVKRGEAVLAAEGPIVAETGAHTGRSPNDKFLVKDPATDGDIWWGETSTVPSSGRSSTPCWRAPRSTSRGRTSSSSTATPAPIPATASTCG